MKIVVAPPDGPIDAVVRVPGSKSVANRALVCAMLADGTSTVSGLPDGDDVSAVVRVLEEAGSLRRLSADTVVVNGSRVPRLPGIVDARLAGTSSRFLTAVAALADGTTIIDGGQPLRERPMADLQDALAFLGAELEPLGEAGRLPVSVSRGRMGGGEVRVRGDVSSQFVSALMLIAPVLDGGLTISVDGPLVSRSYVEMTARTMRSFGAEVAIDASEVRIEPTGYTATRLVVEPDFSSAAFPLCALFLRTGRVRIPGLAASTAQGDSAVLDILRAAGVGISTDGDDIVAVRGDSRPGAVGTVDMSDCSDLVPAVATGLSVCDGRSTVTGIGFIRRKESNRVEGLVDRLVECGADARASEDGIEIDGVPALNGAVIDTMHDHRIAMALSLAALSAGTVTIDDRDVVSKSWPGYFSDMRDILGTPKDAN